MPTLTGELKELTNPIPAQFTTHDLSGGPSVGAREWNTPTLAFSARKAVGAPRVSTVTRSAFLTKMFGDLFWFDHLHLIPQQINLGNILGDQVRTFEVFNGYRSATKTVNLFNAVATSGVIVSIGSTTPPINILAYQSINYTLTVQRTGPAKLVGSYFFGFASGELLELRLTGSRAVVWPYIPQGEFTESYAYLTDVIESQDGTEQRASLRDLPRLSLTHRYLFGDEEINARVENLLADWAGRVFAVPIWQDATTLTSQATAGAVVLNVASTTDRDFRFGSGELVLLYTSEFVFEAAEVLSFTTTTITVIIGIGQTWVAGTRVLPIRLATLRNAPRQRTYATAARDMQMQFVATTLAGYPDESAFTVYRSAPVFLDDMRLGGDTQERQIDRDVQIIDSGTGRAFQSSTKRFSPMSMPFVLDFETRAEQWRLKRFLHARRGSFKSFWVPTWRKDFAVQSTATAPATNIFVKAAKYSDHVFSTVGESRKHIMIEYANGARDFRRINSANLTSPGVLETLTLDSATTQDVSGANVVRISFLLRVRLAADQFDFKHDFAYTGEVGIAVQEVDL